MASRAAPPAAALAATPVDLLRTNRDMRGMRNRVVGRGGLELRVVAHILRIGVRGAE